MTVVGGGPPFGEESLGGRTIDGAGQELLEGGVALASDDEGVREVRLGRVGDHGGVVEVAEHRGRDDDLRARMVEHELQLAPAQDGHHRIGDGADPEAGEVERDELPPVRKLVGDDIACLDPEASEADGDALDARSQFAIGQARALARGHVMGDDGKRLRPVVQERIEVVEKGAVLPEAGRDHGRTPGRVVVLPHGAASAHRGELSGKAGLRFST